MTMCLRSCYNQTDASANMDTQHIQPIKQKIYGLFLYNMKLNIIVNFPQSKSSD